ncbi:MAG: hypothetical protein AB1798_15170 [Spirochaetota bacterium]
MLEAAKYYESQASGLGVTYLSEVEQNVAAIAETPMMWPIVEDELRRGILFENFLLELYIALNQKRLLLLL